MTKTHPGKRARLLELASQTKTPTAVRFGAMKASDVDSPDFDVRNNSLWVARWSGSTILLLIIHESSDPQKVLAAPVTIEPGLQDQESVVVDASANELGVPVTVWLGITREVPIQTLERPLGGLSHETLETAIRASSSHPLPEAEHAFRQLASTSAEQRAEMEDILDGWIEDLQPLPSESPEQMTTQGTIHGKPTITLKQVMEALHVPQRKAMNIVRGNYQLSAGEARQLALHIGSSPEALSSIAEPLPNELLIELQQPRWRLLVRSEAESLKIDEHTARLSVARETFALAARQSGRDTDMWRQRLRTIALGRLHGGTSEGR
ncbi:hypothetical protein [Arthrobacter sp. efr-133-R2A-63]|uniref:hypothetical protein n=1 Tax=Arthrobacter sp. efr-133-R2A-63 TaxID=3040278 RepID=UPI002550D22B|nr:hypothetical protein [Arthrobacter sp. efr-133-R2A-63]